MSLSTRIEAKLREAFAPERLSVIDESAQHAGHQPGFAGAEGTHMRVRIVAQAFAGMTRLARHRAIRNCCNRRSRSLHALAIEPAAPGEETRW
jgi:BolA protein